MSLVVGGTLLIALAASFTAGRLFAAHLNWAQRKLALYLLAFGGTFALVSANKELNEAVIIVSLLMIIAVFFAILTAPDKS